MAAPTYQSTQTTTWATAGSSVVITKPVGLLEGELLIARITTNNGLTVSGLSGFTSFGSQIADSYETFILYKYADSGDVAASNFTFTISNSGSNKMGSLTRISNADALASNLKYAGNAVSNSISPSFAGVTPTNHADDILLLQFWNAEDGASGGSPLFSAYAIATSNPSWTEEYELTTSTDNDGTASMAYATRPQVTATGNFSATASQSGDITGQIVVISIPWSTTIAETVTLTEATKGNLTGLTQETVTLTETVTTEKPQTWSYPNKNSGTWTYPDK